MHLPHVLEFWDVWRAGINCTALKYHWRGLSQIRKIEKDGWLYAEVQVNRQLIRLPDQ